MPLWNDNLVWDESTGRLGIGRATPVACVDIQPGNSGEIALLLQSAEREVDDTTLIRLEAYLGAAVTRVGVSAYDEYRSDDDVPRWTLGMDGSNFDFCLRSAVDLDVNTFIVLANGCVGMGHSRISGDPKSKLHIKGQNGWVILDEQDSNPALSDLDANDAIALYTKGNKLVVAYNDAGVLTYVTLALDGSSTTLVHSTAAP